MITLSGAGTVIKSPDGRVFMVKVKRRDMIRWELPTRILRNGENIFLALYRCVEEESASQIAVRIGKPICYGLNTSQQLGHQFFAMFFECIAENSNVKLAERTYIANLPESSRQETMGASFIDWRQLLPTEIHPQHQQILARWEEEPTGQLFAIISDADSEVSFYNGNGLPKYSFVGQQETNHIINTHREIINKSSNQEDVNSTIENTSQKINAGNNKLKIFLCHSSDDKKSVKALFKKLQKTKGDIWLDLEKLLPGQDWETEIAKAVKQADIVLVCLSKNSFSESGYIQKELRYVLNLADEKPDNTIFVIPLKLEECNIPDKLAKWQWLNFYEANAFPKLLNTLKVRAGQLDIDF